MRILVVNGAPRKSGHTKDLVTLFCNGIAEAGGEPDIVHLTDFTIRPCKGCYYCWTRTNDKAECVLNDDMAALIERFYEADVLILATPLYFYTFSAHLKTFIERLLPVSKPELELARTYGPMKNALLHKERGPKGIGLIAVAGHKGLKIMDGILPTFEMIAEGLGARQVGNILRPESFFLDFPDNDLTRLRRVQAAIEKAGSEIVTHGKMTRETEREVALPLTQDVDQYIQHFQTYWEIAKEKDAFGRSLRSTLKKAIKYDLRVLMHELAGCFNPSAMGDGEAVFMFRFSGKQPGDWHFVVSKKGCRVYQTAHEKPTVTLSATSEIFVSILTERKDPLRLIERGKLQVSGDRSLLQRFPRLFPPPNNR
jgi:multimeric flavodoxin WrbA